MRAHIITEGKVSNTIEVDSLDVFPNLIDASIGGSIGDTWNGTAFVKTPPDAFETTEQAKSVRQTRDAKLAETDWRFRSDMTPSQAWKDYCQALRDVPTQAGFPWAITWPDAP